MENCIFIFDTSAILNLYYLTKNNRNEILNKSLIHFKEQFCLPYHIYYEYNKNRGNTIRKLISEKYDPLLISGFDFSNINK
uniref:PIN-like domain-containing protein n=1 Tax=Heyndrickxia sp. FSL K6-6286 TaxID=2921510 RepID=UPI00406BF9BF